MKITELVCYTCNIPTKAGPYVMSHGRLLQSFPTTIVKLTVEDGTVGFGEACTLGANYLDGHPGSVRETVRLLAPHVLGTDALHAIATSDSMDDLVIGHFPGKAAIDIALWDLRAKLLGVSVSQLMGGAKQTHLGAFQAISLATPSEMATEARRWHDMGFRRWQLKLGNDPNDDALRTHAVTAAIGDDAEFMTADANAGWTVGQALRYVQQISGLNTYIEQPCKQLRDLEQIARTSSLPVLVDESLRDIPSFVDAIELRCVQAINLKPTRVGGLTKAARIRDLAEAMGVMVLVDEAQGADLASAAIAQLAATVSPERFLGVSCFMADHMPMSYQASPTKTGAKLRGGHVVLDDRPGLGVTVDEEIFGKPAFVLTASD
jgi:L-alanine-DL-glutamate epimerase-like enolase superfamily enzyme